MSDFYSRYTDFLKDEKFLRWQLLPDETLDEYWKDFIRENPELNKEIQHAIADLKAAVLNKNILSDSDRLELFHRIQSTINEKRRKNNFRRILQYGTAACAAIALLIIGLNYFNFGEKPQKADNQELIVGNLLQSEDIQLISGEKSHEYQNDIEVKIDEKGRAKVMQKENNEQEQIDISTTAVNKMIVPYGKRTQLNLSDGTKIWLNSGSVLEFPTQFAGKNREIRLSSGEIYLEVAPDKNKSFIVHTSDFNVKVYGTKFNVSMYNDSPHYVVLVEGSVGLKSTTKSTEIKLSPNEQVIYGENGMFNKRAVDATEFVSWKNGYLSFDKTPMTEVLKQIGRYYNLSFNFDQDTNLQKRTCSGKIYLSDDIDNVMTTIALLSSTRYIKQNEQIYILNEK
ncbi:FecR family protein [Anaerorudis cellulosivorans]|uniref:FecR family protein n=1 Tax=Anaerorudis cellulosivorans TaxID=3397862 RepID=UPI00221E7F99|nr:FecR family protein [Seramator thermalis]MCW1734433.1 FecR domain-containing protein [Seramator thermalis]